MSNLQPTVFVIDPDPSVRISLETLIRRAGWAPQTYATGEAFVARPPHLAPGCLILDVALPDLDGLDLVRRLAVDRQELPSIIISGQGDVPMIVRAMKAGAIEFLLKPLANEMLLAAIGQAIARSQAVLQQETDLRDLRQRHDSLSLREREVMTWVVGGLLNKQVGATLGISEITVKAHRGKVMRKMGADSLAGLVGMALRLGLPSVPTTRTLAFPTTWGSYRFSAEAGRKPTQLAAQSA